MPARVRAQTLAASALVLLLASALNACSSGARETLELRGDSAQLPGARAERPTAEFGLPSLESLGSAGQPWPAPPRQSSSINQISFELDSPAQLQNASIFGENLVLAPQAGPAFAVYSMDLPVDEIISVAASGSDGLWLLIADFASRRWISASRFQGGFAVATYTTAMQPLDGERRLFCAVVAPVGAGGQLSSLILNYEGPSIFYVDPTGDDTAVGSSTKPWKTLQHAGKTVVADTIVWARPGMYRGFYTIGSGSLGKPITFLAQPGAVIRPEDGDVLGVLIQGTSVEFFTLDGFAFADFPEQHISIEALSSSNIVLRNLSLDGVNGDAIFALNSSDLLIEDCEFRNIATGYVISCDTCNNAVIRDNTTLESCDAGISIKDCDFAVVEKNTLQEILVSEGIGLKGDCDDCSIRQNQVHTIFDNGIDFNWDFTSPELAQERIQVLANRFYGSADGLACGIAGSGVVDSTFRNNLVYGYTAGAFRLEANNSVASTGNLIAHNTFIQLGPAPASPALTLYQGSSGCTVVNNILTGPSDAMALDNESLTGLVSDHNAIQGTIYFVNLSYNFGAWQLLFDPRDANSVETTDSDLFVSLDTPDYHLKAGSPAIGLADAAFMPGGDIEGTARPQQVTPDSGCFEFVP